MNNAVLSCRICEETHPLAPVSHCAACSGPLDVRYISNGNGSLLADPQELSSDRALLPHRETAIPNRTPLVPAPRVSAALGIDVHLKLETANPTSSFKDRMAASAVKAAQEFGFGTVLCASTGNLGAAVAAHCAACRPRRSHPHARRRGAARTPTGRRGHERLHECAGRSRTAAGWSATSSTLFPWGFLDGNLQPFAVEGIKTIAYEIAEQLDWERRTRSSAPSPRARSSQSWPRDSSSSPSWGSSPTGGRGCTGRSPAAARPSPPPGPTSVRRRA